MLRMKKSLEIWLINHNYFFIKNFILKFVKEKEEYKKTIKDLERRIKDNENNIKRIFNLMVHTDSTMLTNNDWKQQQSFPSFSNSQ